MSSRRKKRSYHHGDLRTAILLEADRVLRTRGPDALSLREIARTLGVSEAAPYHHFRKRADLIAAIAARGFETLLAAFTVREDPDPVQRLVGCADDYLRLAIDDPGAFRAMFGAHVVDLELASFADVAGPGRATRQHLLALCREVVVEIDAAVSGEQLFATVWGLSHGVAWLHVQQEIPDIVADDDAAIALVRRGVEACVAGLPRRPRGRPPSGRSTRARSSRR